MKKEERNQSKFLKSRIKTYSTLAVSAIALDVSAQVGYTDIPDTTLINDNDFCDIDFNNDGFPELNISLNTFYTSRMFGSGSNPLFFRGQVNTVGFNPRTGGVIVDTNNLPVGLNFNDSISSGSSSNLNSFYSYNGLLVNHNFISSNYYGSLNQNSNSQGNFLGVERYLGVRFAISGSTGFHYGWVRLDVANDASSVTIKDFAYDSTANASILAGDRGALVGLKKTSFQKTDFFSSHRQLNFKGSISAKTQLTIIDLKGQKVQEVNLLENQRSQALTNFSNGIYIVEIRNSEAVLRKKLWLETE